MTCEYSFEVVVGDSLSLPLHIENYDTGTSYNLTGCTVYFDVKEVGGATYVIQKTITTHASPTTGDTTINVRASLTDALVAGTVYEFGIKVKNPAVLIDSEAQEFTVTFEYPYFKAVSKKTQE